MGVVYLVSKVQTKSTEGSESEKAATSPAANPDHVVLLTPMTLQAKVPEPVKVAVEQLKDDLISLSDSKEHVAFLMAVNVNTAQAELVPIPTLANMLKLKENLERFPDGVKAALKKNISDEDMKAVESIWHFLDKSKFTTPPLPASSKGK